MIEAFRSLCFEAAAIWSAGGWAMIPIAIVATCLFALALRLRLALRDTGFVRVPETTWRRWVDRPAERRGRIGRLLDAATGASTVAQAAAQGAALRRAEADRFERDLRMIKTCVGAAPLIGLLGTVTGMLSTFDALAHGPGGDRTMGMIADGISEALITTETGLVVALPGLFCHHLLARRVDRYLAFLAQIESVASQRAFRDSRSEQVRTVQRAAAQQVANALHGQLASLSNRNGHEPQEVER